MSKKRKIIIICFVVTVSLVYVGYQIKWSGFSGKKIWDWLDLVIVPAIIALSLSFLDKSQKKTELEIAYKNNIIEQEIAQKKQWQTTFDSYIDKMTNLILEKNLLNTRGNIEAVSIAKIRTRSALRSLNGYWKGEIVRFISDSGLSKTTEDILCNTDLTNADIQNVPLDHINARNTDFSGANLVAANLFGADLIQAKFCNANLRGINFFDAELKGSIFFDADLTGAQMQRADLTSTNFKGASMKAAKLEGCTAHYANFDQVDMNNDRTVFKKADISNARFIKANLSNADFSRSIIKHTDFSGARLVNTNFRNAYLIESCFDNADLSDANLEGAVILGIDFSDSIYNQHTKWPQGFNPEKLSNINIDKYLLTQSGVRSCDKCGEYQKTTWTKHYFYCAICRRSHKASKISSKQSVPSSSPVNIFMAKIRKLGFEFIGHNSQYEIITGIHEIMMGLSDKFTLLSEIKKHLLNKYDDLIENGELSRKKLWCIFNVFMASGVFDREKEDELDPVTIKLKDNYASINDFLQCHDAVFLCVANELNFPVNDLSQLLYDKEDMLLQVDEDILNDVTPKIKGRIEYLNSEVMQAANSDGLDPLIDHISNHLDKVKNCDVIEKEKIQLLISEVAKEESIFFLLKNNGLPLSRFMAMVDYVVPNFSVHNYGFSKASEFVVSVLSSTQFELKIDKVHGANIYLKKANKGIRAPSEVRVVGILP